MPYRIRRTEYSVGFPLLSLNVGRPDHLAPLLGFVGDELAEVSGGAGKLRVLAVTTAAPSQVLPNLASISEFVPGFEASGWFGAGAPKNTSAEIVGRLNREINAALADPKMKARLADLGGTVLPGSPTEFGKLIAEETEKWGKVIRAANIKPE